MNHKRIGLAAVACLAFFSAAQAKMLVVAPPPAALRPGPAEVIVVGKVTGFGSKLVKGEMFKGDERDMQIATVKVGEVLMGKDAKEIKVGFFPPANVQGGPRIIRRGPTVQLKQDEEYCLVLLKHPAQKDVYVALNYYDAIAKKDNPNFAKEVAEIKKSAKLIAKPLDGLKSKKADERFLTAGLLISRYRSTPIGTDKTEQVSADESKLILEALAEADWTTKAPRIGFQLHPQTLFLSLAVTEKDGWKQPKDFTKFGEEAKKWCKDNAGKYRINRFVRETKEDRK
jgi:hypothetical protein